MDKQQTAFGREVVISKAFLQSVYDGIHARDERYNKLGAALSALSEDSIYIFDAATESLVASVLKTLLGAQLYDDWDYLVSECPYMDGGGSIAVEGREYRIFDVDSLWSYWLKEATI